MFIKFTYSIKISLIITIFFNLHYFIQKQMISYIATINLLENNTDSVK
jgi:hypothetical protein